jgi:hypothetical protein
MIRIIKVALSLMLVVFFNSLFMSKVFAVTITIANFPTSISTDVFTVEASVSGATNATNYLRVDLFKDGTTNYFGETYNGSDWYGGSDGKSYFPVQIQNSSASAVLQAQLGNPNETFYPGPGTYKLRIRRYTSSGSQSQNDQQNPIDVQITYVAPTPTPTPTPTLSPTPSPIPTPTPTKSPTPTASPASQQGGPKITPKAETPTPVPIESPEILGLESAPPTPVPSGLPDVENKTPVLAFAFIGAGIILTGLSVFLGIKSVKNFREQNDI